MVSTLCHLGNRFVIKIIDTVLFVRALRAPRLRTAWSFPVELVNPRTPVTTGSICSGPSASNRATLTPCIAQGLLSHRYFAITLSKDFLLFHKKSVYSGYYSSKDQLFKDWTDGWMRRLVALRITAIRETFEELGLLLCSKQHQNDRSSPWANILSDVDVKHWQKQVSKNPGELLNLCKEYKCYPDIWALHYWSNWLTPARLLNRFDTAFFITALEERPERLHSNTEVVHVQWATPQETLEKCLRRELVLFPPQTYELNQFLFAPDCEDLIRLAAARSADGNALFYPSIVKAKDGEIHLLPGDDLYPSDVDYNDKVIIKDETVLKLREGCQTLHRFETIDSVKQFVIRNYKASHIDMGDRVIPVQF